MNEREPDNALEAFDNTLLLLGPDGLWTSTSADADQPRTPLPRNRQWRRSHGRPDAARPNRRLALLGATSCRLPRAMPSTGSARRSGWRRRWTTETRWPSLVRTIAWEAGAWVISVCGFARRSDYPDGLSVVPDDGPDLFTRGGSMIVAPNGEVVTGPLYDEEGILFADCDLRATVRAKYGFDSVGHYGREEAILGLLSVLALHPSEDPDDERPLAPERQGTFPTLRAVTHLGECTTWPTSMSVHPVDPAPQGRMRRSPGTSVGRSPGGVARVRLRAEVGQRVVFSRLR